MNTIKKIFARYFQRGGIFHPTKNYSNRYFQQIKKTAPGKKIVNIGAGGYDPVPGAINIDPYRTGINTVRACGENLPFKNESVDSVLCSAVLEHVREPYLIIEEMYRILKKGGAVYIEMPFLQPFHAAPDDYSRLTITGLKYLLRDFKEIGAGIGVGPGSTVAWIFVEYVQIFFENKSLKRLVKNIAKVITFPLKYFDKFIINRSASAAVASAFYFYGEK
jgi:SAM-dependent methyltransferase